MGSLALGKAIAGYARATLAMVAMIILSVIVLSLPLFALPGGPLGWGLTVLGEFFAVYFIGRTLVPWASGHIGEGTRQMQRASNWDLNAYADVNVTEAS